jgi:hypothetical protein
MVKYEIQRIDHPTTDISGLEWETVGRATTMRGAIRVYKKWYAWHHPKSSGTTCWTGHVRIIDETRRDVTEAITRSWEMAHVEG